LKNETKAKAKTEPWVTLRRLVRKPQRKTDQKEEATSGRVFMRSTNGGRSRSDSLLRSKKVTDRKNWNWQDHSKLFYEKGVKREGTVGEEGA